MHPVNLIASGLSDADPDKPIFDGSLENGVCAITGQHGKTLHRKLLLGKSFCDGERLLAPDSDRVSLDAYIALKYKWERMSSWVCNGVVFKKLNRVEVRNAVLSNAETQSWAGYATTSYKKHGALRAPINQNGKNVWLFETRIVDCTDAQLLNDWWAHLNIALRAGVGRSVLESLDCPSFLIRKVGLKTWMDFETWAKPKSKSALYAFLCYLLPSQEELKNEKA